MGQPGATKAPAGASPPPAPMIAVKVPADTTGFVVEVVGAALCYKLIIQVIDQLSKFFPAYISPIAKPSAATAVCAMFGIKPMGKPQPAPGLMFKSVVGTTTAVAAAEVALRVCSDAQRETAAMIAVALTFMLQKMVLFKGKADAIQVHK